MNINILEFHLVKLLLLLLKKMQKQKRKLHHPILQITKNENKLYFINDFIYIMYR
jgi:hypothetical protein